MKHILILFSFVLTFSGTSFAQGAIAGPSLGCVGSNCYFDDSGSFATGTWSSSDIAVATIDSSSGMAYALSAGTTIITFTISTGGYLTKSFTVDTAILPISEVSTNFCVGTPVACTDPSPGGSWSVGYSYDASISSTGVVTGLSNGTVTIYYTVGGCSAMITDTINAPTPGALAVPPVTCVGSITTVTDSVFGASSGGTWSVSNAAIATIDASGAVTGLSPGTDTIIYTVSAGSCGSASTSTTIIISGTTTPGTVLTGTITAGATATISDYGASTVGTWSTGDPTIASIDPFTGVITGITTGTVTVIYTVDGCGGAATATGTETISLLNGISGHVFFDSSAFYGSAEVWLITYNPVTLDLEAIDSVSVSIWGGTEAYYQFTGVPTDSFRIKAAVSGDSFYVTTGYVPTYHTSSFYWSAANVLYHAAGSADINQDIDMAYGTFTAGPGFIAGNVTTGANRDASSSIPAVGMLVFAVNATTNALAQQTYTDDSGNYSFSNLPLGTYFIYPEQINYGTIAYTDITLSSSSSSMSAANFIEHTLSHTITPVIENVNVQHSAATIVTFPNPVNEMLTVQWQETGNEKGTVCITDITGREIFKTTLVMNQGSGKTQLDISGLVSGLYIVTIKSANVNYTNKILVQH